MKWSPWQVVMSTDDKSTDETWEKRKGLGKGYRRKNIFGGNNAKPALYEFSVQTGKHGKRYTVYSKLCRGVNNSASWEARFLGKTDIKSQIGDIIKKGCSVSVRRLIINKRSIKQTNDIASSMRRYDYAWRRQRSERRTHRTVVKSSIQISSDKF